MGKKFCKKCGGTGWITRVLSGQREFGGDASSTYTQPCECNPQPCPNCGDKIEQLQAKLDLAEEMYPIEMMLVIGAFEAIEQALKEKGEV